MMWVYGKVEQGWYLAASVWSDKLAERWKALGYQVERTDPRKEAA